MKKLLTIQQAADKLGVSTKTLRRWEARGVLNVKRTVGNQRRYAETQLAKFKKPGRSSTKESASEVPIQSSPTKAAEQAFQEVSTSVSQVRKAIEQQGKSQDVSSFSVEKITTASDGESVSFIKSSLQVFKDQFFSTLTQAQKQIVIGALSSLLVVSVSVAGVKTGVFDPVFSRLGSPPSQEEAFQQQQGLGSVLGEKTSVDLSKVRESIGKGQVLQAADTKLPGSFIFTVNVPSNFANNLSISGSATVSGDLTVRGKTLDLGAGTINASNVIYSLAVGSGLSSTGGQTPSLTNSGVLSLGSKVGALTLEAGGGITIDGLKITNSAQGADQKIFKTIKVGTTTFSAGSNTDTLEFIAGTGITLTPNTTDKKLTIVGQDASISTGWTDGGTTVHLATSSDNVGLGTTTASSFKLQIAGSIGPNSDNVYDLGSSALYFRNIYVKNMISGSSGTVGFWQRTSGALAPADVSDDIILGASATTSAVIKLVGTTGTIFSRFLNLTRGATISAQIASDIPLRVNDQSGSTAFEVSTTQVTSNLPAQFTAAGDVSIAYDLAFINPIVSYIKSQGSLYIQAGEVFNSSDLLLDTFNKGNVVADAEAFVTNAAATISSQLVVGITTAPANIGSLYMTNSSTRGKALAILNQTESTDIFTASASGTTRFVIQSGGNVGIGIGSPLEALHVVGNATAAGNLVLSGAARNIQTTAFNTLSIGGSSTGDILLLPRNSAGSVGINTSAPLGTFDIRRASGTTPVATISGATSFASLVVDNSGVGDIFTASSSGLNRFVIRQGGDVGIGTTLPALRFHVVDSTRAATAAAMIENSNTGTNADGLAIKLGLTGNGTQPTHGNSYVGNRWVEFLNGDGVRYGAIEANDSTGVNYKTSGADFAEYFTKANASDILVPGDVVCYKDAGVGKCDEVNKNIIGVVSLSPGFTGGEDGPNKVLVGLVGQLSVKVASGSDIKQGDFLATGSIAGSAVKATSAGFVFGKALAPVSSDGTVFALLNVGWYDPAVYLTDSGDLNITQIHQGQFALSGVGGSPIKTTGAFDTVVAANAKVGSLDVSKLVARDIEVKNLTIAGTALPEYLDAYLAVKNAEVLGVATSSLLVSQSTEESAYASQSALAEVADTSSQNQETIALLEEKVLAFGNRMEEFSSRIEFLQNLMVNQGSSSAALLAPNASAPAVLSFASLSDLGVDEEVATISGNLMVTGRSVFKDVGITGAIQTGLLTVDGLLGSINTLVGPLELQSEARGGVRFLSGKVTIDEKGNLVVAEKVTAKTIAAEEFRVVGTQSAGSGTIAVGQLQIEIQSSVASSSSRIFLTPTTLTSKQLVVTNKEQGRFKVAISSTEGVPVTFDWFIVGSE